MAGSPPVLILDEPTNSLDPQRRKQVWDNLRALNHDQGTTVIFITHDAIEAEKIIQRVGIMRQGELAVMGKPAELKAQVIVSHAGAIFFTDTLPTCRLTGTPLSLDTGRWLCHSRPRGCGRVLNG
jgi:ABC-type multidrug transport system ATPase subunit